MAIGHLEDKEDLWWHLVNDRGLSLSCYGKNYWTNDFIGDCPFFFIILCPTILTLFKGKNGETKKI